METLLEDVIAHTHDTLAERLDAARRAMPDGTGSRRCCPPIDYFLSETSRHLHVVDEVLLPAGRRCDDGAHLVKEALRAQKDLELELFHVKSHEYGSVWERDVDWGAMWTEIARGLAEERRHEQLIGARLDRTLPEDERARLAERLTARLVSEPSRPHPRLPHTGVLGALSRRVARITDAWWDMVEGRFVLRPAPRRKVAGAVGRYLMASTRFEGEEDGPA